MPFSKYQKCFLLFATFLIHCALDLIITASIRFFYTVTTPSFLPYSSLSPSVVFFSFRFFFDSSVCTIKLSLLSFLA